MGKLPVMFGGPKPPVQTCLILSINTDFPVSSPTETVTTYTENLPFTNGSRGSGVLGPHSHAAAAVHNLPLYGSGSGSARAYCHACTDGVGDPAESAQETE